MTSATEKMLAALQKIERWFDEFPETGKTWPETDTPMSYGACYGSNGERDFMRAVARDAILEFGLEAPVGVDPTLLASKASASPLGQGAIDKALDVIHRYGGIDGDHHKTWVIDQVVRALTGDGYEQWVIEQRGGEDGPETYSWDVGIPP